METSSYAPPAPPPRPERHPPGHVVAGKFRIERRIGSGGGGTVYEARHVLTGRAVALKWLAPSNADAQADERFFQEAKSASQLSHPSIVGVLDLLLDPVDHSFWMVQELLVGQSLRDLLEQVGRLSHRDVLPIIVPLMSALALAHRHGIIHRDLKPDNIFLAETAVGMVPKLIDFGIAKLTDATTELVRTQTGVLMGTPRYMSPEQTIGVRKVDGRSDIWSLGVVLYEMLSGQSPFASMARSEEEGGIYELMQALFAEIREGRIIPLASAAPDLPADLVAAVEGALRPDPKARYPRMEAFLEALFACADYAPERERYADWLRAIETMPPPKGEAAPAAPQVVPRGTPSATPTPPATSARESEPAPKAAPDASTDTQTAAGDGRRFTSPKGRRLVLALTAAGALAALALAAALLWPGRPAPPPRGPATQPPSPAAHPATPRPAAAAAVPTGPTGPIGEARSPAAAQKAATLPAAAAEPAAPAAAAEAAAPAATAEPATPALTAAPEQGARVAPRSSPATMRRAFRARRNGTSAKSRAAASPARAPRMGKRRSPSRSGAPILSDPASLE